MPTPLSQRLKPEHIPPQTRGECDSIWSAAADEFGQTAIELLVWMSREISAHPEKYVARVNVPHIKTVLRWANEGEEQEEKLRQAIEED